MKLLIPKRAAWTLALLAAHAAQAEPGSQPDWAVQVEAGPVAFRGLASFDDVGKPGTMMYPAPNVVGLLAGIVTHAVIARSTLDNKKTGIEEQADKVLDPYREHLAGLTREALVQAALPMTTVGHGRLLPAGGAAGDALVVRAAPVFSMTQDQTALVLDNAVVISPTGSGARAGYQNTVRVVSRPLTGVDPAAYWGAEHARALKEESARMLAQSLDLAVADAAVARPQQGAPAQRTVRYAEGGKEVFERAEVINEKCGRAVLRNLRGWLMSVPLVKQQMPADPDCTSTVR
jgi:hypothetical protein